MLLLSLVELFQLDLVLPVVVVEDEVRLDEPIFQLLPVLLSSGFKFFEEWSARVVNDGQLALESNVLAVLEEAVLDAGMIAILHL